MVTVMRHRVGDCRDLETVEGRNDCRIGCSQERARLHERGQVMRSKVKVVVNSQCEQMLGKLHADPYSNDEHFMYVDTDRIVDVLVVAQRQVFTIQTADNGGSATSPIS